MRGQLGILLLNERVVLANFVRSSAHRVVVSCVRLDSGKLVCPNGPLVSLLQMRNFGSAVPQPKLFNVHHVVVLLDRTPV